MTTLFTKTMMMDKYGNDADGIGRSSSAGGSPL